MEYVVQYLLAKYSQYNNGLEEVAVHNKFESYNNLSINEESSRTPPHEKPKFPKGVMTKSSLSPSVVFFLI